MPPSRRHARRSDQGRAEPRLGCLRQRAACSAASAGRPTWRRSPTRRLRPSWATSASRRAASRTRPARTAPGAIACAAPHGGKPGEPEIDDETFGDVVFYQSTLAPPARRSADDPHVLRGAGAVRAGAVRRLPPPELRDGRARRSQRSASPSVRGQPIWPVHRPAAARHGRGARRRPPGLSRQRAPVAHAAAVGHRPAPGRQRAPAAAARRARRRRARGDPVARRRGTRQPRAAC